MKDVTKQLFPLPWDNIDFWPFRDLKCLKKKKTTFNNNLCVFSEKSAFIQNATAGEPQIKEAVFRSWDAGYREKSMAERQTLSRGAWAEAFGGSVMPSHSVCDNKPSHGWASPWRPLPAPGNLSNHHSCCKPPAQNDVCEQRRCWVRSGDHGDTPVKCACITRATKPGRPKYGAHKL